MDRQPTSDRGSGGQPVARLNVGLLALQVGGMAVVFGLALFGTAGTFAWPAAWVYLVEFFGFVLAISIWLSNYNPELMRERMTGVGRADQKRWDKLFVAAASVVFYGWLVFMPLDAVRFQWSHVPIWLQSVGASLLAASFVLFFLVFRENSYLSPAVRVQRERGQTVISTGPYAYVRHPMYAAVIPYGVGTSLLLGLLARTGTPCAAHGPDPLAGWSGGGNASRRIARLPRIHGEAAQPVHSGPVVSAT